MKTYDFQNKTFLITGASSGIGRETACRLAEDGASLILLGRNIENLEETQKKCISLAASATFAIFALDLTDEKAVAEFIAKISPLDGVVISSGKIEPFPASFINWKKIDSMMHTNFYTAAIIVSLLLKQKKINENGSLVFISSISSQFPHLGGTLYSSSKAALEAYVRNVALEFSNKRIRANSISPGMVKTPLFDEAVDNISEDTMNKHLDKYPLGVGYPKDVANLCAFLLSGQSRWMTGNNIVLDGGLHLGTL
ncbi:SDR family NAD(P)-dependent oxidoreductase [Flavobacterium fluviatile]|uniref:SDR family NAD(P)-dependent oxidoreductase n=1 Tax=Flavobacterium fluviatile TaxID=1862387 RepID=UPI0013D28894|nr:SDR family oxidoreductase [Flavobacterium fluviatile]